VCLIIKELAEDVGTLPDVERSSDPADDFLLAMCEAGTDYRDRRHEWTARAPQPQNGADRIRERLCPNLRVGEESFGRRQKVSPI